MGMCFAILQMEFMHTHQSMWRMPRQLVNASWKKWRARNYLTSPSSENAVKVDGESIQVDTQLLFQRLVIAAKTDLESALTYELCMFPKALFETPELLLEAQKSTLADSIWTAVDKKK